MGVSQKYVQDMHQLQSTLITVAQIKLRGIDMNLYQNKGTLFMLTASEQMEVIDSPKLLLYLHGVLQGRLYRCFSRKRTCCNMQQQLKWIDGSFAIQVLAFKCYALYERIIFHEPFFFQSSPSAIEF